MSQYIKPVNIKDDMGGMNGKLDNRMREIFELLSFLPDKYDNILDIGFGKGQIPYYFLNKGKHVTSIGLELESYGIQIEKVRKDGINLLEADIENTPFKNNEFDCVIASHILEHILDFGKAVSDIKRVLTRGGVFVIFIPRYTDYVCAGHVNTGWNLGQLIYVLTVLGFDTKHGKFVEYGYSLCAMVKISDRELPVLRGDKGDIQLLSDGGFFPFSVKEKNGLRDGFDAGNIVAVNWRNFDSLRITAKSRTHKIFLMVMCFIKKLMGRNFTKLIHVANEADCPKKINPKCV